MSDGRIFMVAADELREQARRHEAAGRYERAVQCYRSALERQQESGGEEAEPSLYLSLADLHFRRGDPALALQHYRLAAERYRELGLTPNAETLHKMTRRLFPERVEPYLNLALLCFGDGREGEAEDVLQDLADTMAAGEDVTVSPDQLRELLSSASPDGRERLEEALRARPPLRDLLV